MASESIPAVPVSREPSGRLAGALIILSWLLSVAFMSHHPIIQGPGLQEVVADMERQAMADHIVHGALIALVGVLLCGFSCLASRLGLDSFVVRGGLIAYALAAGGMVLAALADGFVTPEFIGRFHGRPTSELEMMKQIMAFCGIGIRVCTRFGVVAMSVAVVLWSVALLRGRGTVRVVGAFGWFAGAVPLILMSIGLLPMNVHGVLTFMIAQAVWSATVAGLLVRGDI
jgi:hypothetical protein